MQSVYLVGQVIGMIVFTIAGIKLAGESRSKRYCVGCLIVLIIALLGTLGCSYMYSVEVEKYEANLEIKQEKKEIKYELLSLDSNEVQGWTTSGEADGIYLLLYKNESYNTEGEVTYKETYQFYYTKNPNTGEVGRMELDAETTKIFLIENDETPYLMETVVQQYEINYNIDPPVTTTYGDKIITYSLHIPKGSIAGDINITE